MGQWGRACLGSLVCLGGFRTHLGSLVRLGNLICLVLCCFPFTGIVAAQGLAAEKEPILANVLGEMRRVSEFWAHDAGEPSDAAAYQREYGRDAVLGLSSQVVGAVPATDGLGPQPPVIYTAAHETVVDKMGLPGAPSVESPRSLPKSSSPSGEGDEILQKSENAAPQNNSGANSPKTVFAPGHNIDNDTRHEKKSLDDAVTVVNSVNFKHDTLPGNDEKSGARNGFSDESSGSASFGGELLADTHEKRAETNKQEQKHNLSDVGNDTKNGAGHTTSFPPAQYFDSLVSRLSLSEKIGQLLMVGFRGVGDASEPSMGKILHDIEQGTVGGVILFDYDVTTQSTVRNIVSLEQVASLTRKLQHLAPIPLFISVDQEGGRVARLKSTHGMPDLASPKYFGAGPLDATYEAYAITAQHLAAIGINVNFAPGVDVDIDPLSPAIGKLERAYSPDPRLVASHAGVFANALEKHGVTPAFKHFPGHGSAAADTHLGLADVTQTWKREELDPYKMLLPEHPRAMVMVGHVFHRLLDDSYPASLSRNIITGLLRANLGWDGLVITDDLDMQAISDYYNLKECVGLALNAGVDILLFGNNLQYDPRLPDKLFQSVLDLVEEGEVSEERINEACGRVLRAKYVLFPSFFRGDA